MIIVLWIVFTFIVAIIGGNRKIGFWPAFLLSAFLSPLVGLIITLLSPSTETFIVTTTNPTPPPAKSPQQSVADELERLNKLHESGAITDDEYQKAKNKIIASFD
jgi:hypothetical protein